MNNHVTILVKFQERNDRAGLKEPSKAKGVNSDQIKKGQHI